ncbi:unnamed protein product [Caenorhabditis brenneri]
MAQSPTHDEPSNNPPRIPLETGVPDNSPPNGSCPSEQSSAPVGPHAPERFTNGNLDSASPSVDNGSLEQVLARVGTQALEAENGDLPANSATATPETSTRTTDGQPKIKAIHQNVPTAVHSAPAGTSPHASEHRKRLPTQNRQRASTNCDGTGSCTCRNCVEAVEVFASGPGERVKMTRSGRPTGDQSNETATSAAKKARVPKRDFFHGLPPGSDEFMSVFIRLEMTLYSQNNTFKVHVFENGYEIDLGDFKDVYKFKNKEGLKMKAPLDFAWETITKYISSETVLGINYSNGKIGKQLDDMKLGKYLDQFKISEELRKVIINSITLEFSGTDLGRNFTVPLFVTENSMIQELEDTLNLKLKNPKITKEERERLEKLINEMPRYTKFLIMSQAKSFTDVHFDFSGTSVYYHVFKGQKIFYIAPPTAENLEIYMTHKEKGHKTWMGAKLSNQWQRIVINEGETAMIPGGYLHFVYTPVDSLVIGGNFLMKKYAKLQFQCTEHEESLLPKRGEINTSHLFEGFRNGMWGYLEYCILPRLKQSNDQESVELGRIFAEGCNPEARCLEKHIWYTKEEKKALHSELKTCLGIADSDQPTTSAASNPVRKAPGKQRQMRREEGEVAGTLEEASTSAASDSNSNLKRKQNAPSKRTMKKDKEESLEDIEENGSEATAQAESSSTTLPSNLKNLERKQAGFRRPAKPSTSAAANPKRTRNECNDSVKVGQEGEVPRKMKTSSHSSTFPLASTADRQNREVPRTTSKLNEKEPGSVEEQMEAVQKENVKIVRDEDPASVHNYPDLDDYDTGSHEQQKMDLDLADNRMEEFGEENDTVTLSGSPSPARTNEKDNDAESRIFEMNASISKSNARNDANREDQPTSTAADSKKMESHPAVFTDPSTFSKTPPNDTTTSASNRLPVFQQDETKIMKAPEAEQEKLSSVFSDPKMTKPKPNEEQIEVVQEVQEKMREKQGTTPSDELVQPVSTLDTSSNSVIPVIESNLLRLSASQTNAADAMKVPSIEEDTLSLSVSEEKTPEPNKESLGKVPNVHAKTPVEQETTPSDENILPTSSFSKIPEEQGAAPTTPYSLPSVPTTVHLADMQNMPTSPKLLPQQEQSDNALFPQNQLSQPRELLISLLKEKRQVLSAIVMQELDNTQVMQIATLLLPLPVSASITEGIHEIDDISEAVRMISDNEKQVSEQARAEKDQLGNKEAAADNNEKVVDPEKEKKEKQLTGLRTKK